MKKVQLNSAKLKLNKERIALLSIEQVQVVKGGDNNVIIDNTQQNFLSLFACKTHKAPYCCPPPPVVGDPSVSIVI